VQQTVQRQRQQREQREARHEGQHFTLQEPGL
jgi:hypothetical protein